eukprot:2137792-Rhodomonas_salina.1
MCIFSSAGYKGAIDSGLRTSLAVTRYQASTAIPELCTGHRAASTIRYAIPLVPRQWARGFDFEVYAATRVRMLLRVRGYGECTLGRMSPEIPFRV